MKKAVPNQNRVPYWNTGRSKKFIYESHEIYQKFWMFQYHIEDHYHGPQEPSYYLDVKDHYTSAEANWILINFLYREGRMRRILACDYASFVKTLLPKEISFSTRYFRYSYLEAPFRVKHETVKWKEKGKKTLSEKKQIKVDWRKHKKVSKDKQNAAWSYSKRGACCWLKRLSNKMHRQWERQQISHEKWDDMSDKDYKYFLDPWMWS